MICLLGEMSFLLDEIQNFSKTHNFSSLFSKNVFRNKRSGFPAIKGGSNH
ncbi:hypothetical protein SAMN05421780_102303 [Flexibacter flexilis DSM 6793]|uniref:Uncharacterized protein n=1 Tax=Flexibacter flexilis DSM 6793 TaxID=927664 RepID=A0A1I1FSG6_9BACT|nr:hypothetical protein SAMN05421780_102303 [Flexibacter flexilis DSM 6793]